ncbi:MAG: polyphosphate kinase 2 family protein, partial [Candidatus Limnocylindria bacterium]
TKRWKFSMGDLAERARWDDYQAAFDAALTRTSTDHAPWYIIPANRKWFRNLAVASILADTIAGLRPRYPAVADDIPADLTIT